MVASLWLARLIHGVLQSNEALAKDIAPVAIATLVAAIWGLAVWREFRDAPAGTSKFLVLMLAGYSSGLILIGTATQ